MRSRASGPEVTLVLGVRLLDTIEVLAGPNGEVVEVVLPEVAVPARVVRTQAEQVIDHVLEVERPIARAELQDFRQGAAKVTKDRKDLRGIACVLNEVKPLRPSTVV